MDLIGAFLLGNSVRWTKMLSVIIAPVLHFALFRTCAIWILCRTNLNGTYFVYCLLLHFRSCQHQGVKCWGMVEEL